MGNSEQSEISPDQFDKLSKIEQKIYLEEKQDNDNLAKFSWFGIVYKLAGGDITKFEDIYETEWILALNFLQFSQLRENKIRKNGSN